MNKEQEAPKAKEPETKNTKNVWYKHGWGLAGAITFFPYFIIWYAWAKSKWSEELKIGTTITVAVITLLILSIVFATASYTPVTTTTTITTQQKAEETQEQKAKREAESKKAEAEANKKPDFSAKITAYNPVNPATLRFIAKVTNKGEAEGKFSCFVNAQDSSGTYKGYDVFSTDEMLKPKKSDVFSGSLVITNEGAYYVDEITINCSDS